MIVSFDFDHTLRFETGELNTTTMLDLHKHIDAGDEVWIISSRPAIKENRDFLEAFCKEHAPTVAGIRLTDGHLKIHTLNEIGSTKHFDDDPDELLHCHEWGIMGVDCFNQAKWNEHLIELGVIEPKG